MRPSLHHGQGTAGVANVVALKTGWLTAGLPRVSSNLQHSTMADMDIETADYSKLTVSL